LLNLFDLWDLLGIVLQPWCGGVTSLALSGHFSAKLVYEGFFKGSIQLRLREYIWKSWAPGKGRCFMWIVVHKRCWTADSLAKWGLPHPVRCPHCDQVEETLDHQLTTVYLLDNFCSLLQQYGLQALSPAMEDASFEDWWHRTNEAANSQQQQGVNSLVILGARTLWKQNRCLLMAP